MIQNMVNESEFDRIMKDIMIIDGHVHTFETDEISSKVLTAFNKLYEIHFKNSGTGSIDDVLRNMKEIGIDYTVMVNFAGERIIQATNEFTLHAAHLHPELIPFVSFHPAFEEENCKLLDSYIDNGAKGIKFHTMAQQFSPFDRRLHSLYDYCNNLAFPIVFHCGRVSNARLNELADLEAIEPVIKKYPNIPIILTHMVDGNRQDVLRCAEQYENVFFDTSIVITGNQCLKENNIPSWLDDDEVVEIVRNISAERVLFGSDYPWGDPKADIDRIIHMKLEPKEKEQILGQNMRKLLRM